MLSDPDELAITLPLDVVEELVSLAKLGLDQVPGPGMDDCIVLAEREIADVRAAANG